MSPLIAPSKIILFFWSWCLYLLDEHDKRLNWGVQESTLIPAVLAGAHLYVLAGLLLLILWVHWQNSGIVMTFISFREWEVIPAHDRYTSWRVKGLMYQGYVLRTQLRYGSFLRILVARRRYCRGRSRNCARVSHIPSERGLFLKWIWDLCAIFKC